ncbi:MAG: hypothetical protein JO033_21060 [Acidobacteriaceae bacterium]|nr:hypothetical protein [Acidobacteriaceae bacterium]MBV9498167.1 hypothetical protein [Acidobacteriaceae bacterium]
MTTFSDFSDLGLSSPKHVKGELALKVMYTESTTGTQFSIYLKALESRSRDPEWLTPETDEVINDAKLFVKKLRNELEHP